MQETLMDKLIQKYLKGQTTREEERKILDEFMKFYNTLAENLRRLGVDKK